MLNLKTSDFDFEVPEKLIALEPVNPRHNSRLVIVSEKFELYKFKKISEILNPGDCLIVNDTKVLPGMFSGMLNKKKIYFTLNKNLNNRFFPIWEVFAKPLKKIKIGDEVNFTNNIKGTVVKINRETKVGLANIKFNCSPTEFRKFLNKNASLALPNYITKKRKLNDTDYKNYQTIFARKTGAIAAPTASLHFSKEIIKEIKKKKVNIIKVTLHVNGGTFLPIKTEKIDNHKMHYEFGKITKESAEKINEVKKKGKKCIAVGTTVLRLLETAKNEKGIIKKFEGKTNIFIKPGWKINSVDGLITNFHTPRSTLFVLICSMIGFKKATELYKFAIKNNIRFYSYGDSCLIWN